MLSLIPIATISFSIFSNFASFHAQVSDVKRLIIKTFLPGIGTALGGYIDEFISNADSLSVIGIGALIFSCALLMYEIHSTFNKVFGSIGQTSFREKFFELWALITGLPFIVVGIAWTFSMLLEKYGLDMGGILGMWQPRVCSWIAFLIVLSVFSPKGTRYVAITIAATVGSILYAAAQFIFIEYISLPIIPNILYGALAIIPLLQMWLLILWSIVIFSATVAAELNMVLNRHFQVAKGDF